MTKATTAQTLALIAAMNGLTFRPMDDNDFATWADAEPDAQIAFAGGEALASAICDISGESILTEGDDAVAIAHTSGDAAAQLAHRSRSRLAASSRARAASINARCRGDHALRSAGGLSSPSGIAARDLALGALVSARFPGKRGRRAC